MLNAMARTKKKSWVSSSDSSHMAEVITKRRVSDDVETDFDDGGMEEIVKEFEKWVEEEAKNTLYKAAKEKEPTKGSQPATLKISDFAPKVIKEVRTSRFKTKQTPFVAPSSSLTETQLQYVEELTVNGKDCQLVLFRDS
ncbi:uncharacterized protein LOC133037445 [Cannabis sativa]|uniref:uncharacterized protein LOC133037445 n=1 Tax=Cannabis sativa TaxID=3483 RepID=UPI0029C9C190|nr:uncharacterized protein LOC133037445 [Cannabis sativa]